MASRKLKLMAITAGVAAMSAVGGAAALSGADESEAAAGYTHGHYYSYSTAYGGVYKWSNIHSSFQYGTNLWSWICNKGSFAVFNNPSGSYIPYGYMKSTNTSCSSLNYFRVIDRGGGQPDGDDLTYCYNRDGSLNKKAKYC